MRFHRNELLADGVFLQTAYKSSFFGSESATQLVMNYFLRNCVLRYGNRLSDVYIHQKKRRVVKILKIFDCGLLELEAMLAAQTPVVYAYASVTYLQTKLLLVAMEHAGKSMLNLAGALTDQILLHVSLSVAEKVNLVHDAGFLHYDISLENLLYRPKDKKVTLIDFGLASHFCDTPFVPRYCGKKVYMAPEQVHIKYRSAECTPQAIDIYALGVVFYALVTGNFPHDGVHCSDYLRLAETDSWMTSVPPASHLQTKIIHLAQNMCHPLCKKRPSLQSVILELQSF